MNPFIKSSVMSGTQLADKLTSRIEKARTDQSDPNESLVQQQEQAAEQAEAEMKQQHDQQKMQKQQEQEEKRKRMETDKKVSDLVRASNTPSFKPYVIKQARGLGGVFSNLVAEFPRTFRVAGKIGEGGLTLGSGAGNAYLWDQMVYDSPMFGEGGVTDDKVRGFGAALAGLTGMLVPRSVYSGLKRDGLYGGAKSGLIAGGALPAFERVASIGIFDMLPTAVEHQKLKLQQLKDEIASSGTDKNDSWKWIAGTGLGLAAIPALAYTYKALRNAGKEPEDVKRDRVALEIPSHKISDSLYNSLGREILFKDKKEDEREQKKAASVKRAEGNMAMTREEAYNTLSPRAFAMWTRDSHKPSGLWNTVEGFAPLVSALAGGPQIGTWQNRLAQHLVPLDPQNVLPRVQNQWTQTLNSMRRPRAVWTPGQEFTVTPDYQLA